MSSIITKKPGQKHFTKTFAEGVCSDRLVLPIADKCSVKVTRFRPPKDFHAEGIVYTVDETVFIMSGYVVITTSGSRQTQLGPGSLYHVRAGDAYDLTVLSDAVLLCVFSPAGGIVPDDE